jgi:hypothetical protein
MSLLRSAKSRSVPLALGSVLLVLFGGMSCQKKAQAPAKCPPCEAKAASPDAGSTMSADSTAAVEKTPPRPDLEGFLPERYFAGPDNARSDRKPRANVVILFAPSGPMMPVPEAGLASVEKLRLQPIVCVLGGKLAFGARCGEAMPPRTKVRLTDTGSSGFEEIDVERSPSAYHDRNGDHTYAPPYGPACCMYNTCVGKTVPYFAKTSDPHFVLMTTKTVFGIWPADAELEMTVLGPGPAEDVSVGAPPWTSLPCDKKASCLVQALQIGERRYASIRNGLSGTAMFADLGKGFVRLSSDAGVRELYALSATDLDRDGRPELLVYAHWANDYGLSVYANDGPAPAYGFSCGNI